MAGGQLSATGMNGAFCARGTSRLCVGGLFVNNSAEADGGAVHLSGVTAVFTGTVLLLCRIQRGLMPIRSCVSRQRSGG